jgi:hypothetical protein
VELEGPCRTAGCKEQHRHPITGALPDYHWVRNDGIPQPRWIRQSFRRPGSDHREWFYKTDEVARSCNVSQETVRTWIRSGRLRSYPANTDPGAQGAGARYYVKGCDLEAFLRTRGQAYPRPEE